MDHATSPLVDVRGIWRRLGLHQALQDVTFTVPAGDILGIIGRSGAGKSTLIRCLNGLERVDRGSIRIDGTEIAGLPDAALQQVRRRSGMVFQHFNLLSAKTVAANVALPLRIAGVPRRRRDAQVAELLELVGLAAHAEKHPGQLSGGQKQRVGIARALAARPALLLCDEATSALDPETTTSILALLDDINRKLGLTIILITHEMSVIRALARRVVVLEQGHVVEEGTVADIFARPGHDVTRSLLRGLRPALPAEIAARVRPECFAGAAALLRIDIGDANSPFTDLVEPFGINVRLLHGGVERVHGIAIGRLFVALTPAEPSALPSIIAFLSARTQAVEHLGYVDASA